MKAVSLFSISIILFIVIVMAYLYSPERNIIGSQASSVSSAQNASVHIALKQPTYIPAEIVTHATATTPTSTTNKRLSVKKTPDVASTTSPTASGPMAVRIKDPYPTPSEDFATINIATRAALVNIFCVPSDGTMSIVSGSGVIIDPRGVIITNAHVAQYVLLAKYSRASLTCTIRSGSPSKTLWLADVLYIPPVWVREHAVDIKSQKPTGTGEHDYAFLRIVSPVGDNPLPTSFPHIVFDTRESIGFVDDMVLGASYPAEFLGGISIGNSLYAVSSISTIRQLFTFTTNSVDLISIGSVIGAQGGSSGGAVINAWGRLIGIVTTTSNGATTADRDLRAITMSYIDRDLKAQTGMNLKEFLNGDLNIRQANFNNNTAHTLTESLVSYIKK